MLGKATEKVPSASFVAWLGGNYGGTPARTIASSTGITCLICHGAYTPHSTRSQRHYCSGSLPLLSQCLNLRKLWQFLNRLLFAILHAASGDQFPRSLTKWIQKPAIGNKRPKVRPLHPSKSFYFWGSLIKITCPEASK